MTYAPLKRSDKTATVPASIVTRQRPKRTNGLSVDGQPLFGIFPGYHVPGPVQTKLSVGAVGDPLEHEADVLAESVMAKIQRPAKAPASGLASTCSTPSLDGETLQRKCDACSEEDEVPVKVQRKATNSADSAGFPAIESQLNRIRSGGGRPLEPGLRRSMEHGFGADFSRVKFHADDRVTDLAQRLNARAFTAGTDVFFNRGELRPAERAGQELIAHELVHVLQQGGTETIRRKRDAKSAPECPREHIDRNEAIDRIRQYLKGFVFNEDENAILCVLRNSTFSEVIRDRAEKGAKDDNRLVYEQVLRRFHGDERKKLKAPRKSVGRAEKTVGRRVARGG